MLAYSRMKVISDESRYLPIAKGFSLPVFSTYPTIISLAQALSVMSKMIAKVAKQIDYDLAETPFNILSPLRILLFRRT